MLKKMTELVADILNYLPWGEISPKTAQEVADHLLDNDVVPVVRCKDCKHFVADTKVGGKCCISDDWYCADGERKEQ